MQELINTFLFDKVIPNLLSEGCPTDLKIFYNDENKTFSYVYQGEPDLERILTKLDAPLDIIALISVHLPETSDSHFMKFEKLKEFNEDEDDLVQTWGSRINSHVTYLFKN